MVSHIRIWSPFVIAYVAATVTLIFESRIGEYLDIYNPLFGYLEVELRAGVPIGFVAALASRIWRGLLTFVLGLLAAGETAVILGVLSGADLELKMVVGVPFLVALTFGILGVPTYVVVTLIASAVRWARGRSLRP